MFRNETNEKRVKYVMYYSGDEGQKQYAETFKDALKKHGYCGSFENVLVKSPYNRAVASLAYLNNNVSDDELMKLLDNAYESLMEWKKEMMSTYKRFRKILQKTYDMHMSEMTSVAC